MIKRYFKRLKTEFKGYNAGKFGKDVLAGITVAAVALPLALAFGISSGATAAAGLITALIAGVVIGLLSGASYQISGPTGAMAAILARLWPHIRYRVYSSPALCRVLYFCCAEYSSLAVWYSLYPRLLSQALHRV